MEFQKRSLGIIFAAVFRRRAHGTGLIGIPFDARFSCIVRADLGVSPRATGVTNAQREGMPPRVGPKAQWLEPTAHNGLCWPQRSQCPRYLNVVTARKMGRVMLNTGAVIRPILPQRPRVETRLSAACP